MVCVHWCGSACRCDTCMERGLASDKERRGSVGPRRRDFCFRLSSFVARVKIDDCDTRHRTLSLDAVSRRGVARGKNRKSGGIFADYVTRVRCVATLGLFRPTINEPLVF
jgi:hypothetical protein